MKADLFQAQAPLFNYSTVNVSTYLYRGTQDWLADPQDIADYLLPNLNPAIIVQDLVLDFNHLDFIWGLNAAEDIYKPIITAITNDF